MNEHRGACNLARAQVQAFQVDRDSRVLQFASFSFDACVWEVLMTVTQGACLCLPDRDMVLVGEVLVEQVERLGITHVTLPPVVLSTLPEAAQLATVGVLVVAGEAVAEALVQRWAPGRMLINAYGPTESTVCATMYACKASEGGPPP
ncbi:AMP-binding protein, partial [Paraburkholderia aspalathi]|uniref:AMP-binding protein n=1 Tax=Paraburkholderia aspalathi TaxID=1324617 RepID=UPI0038B98C65